MAMRKNFAPASYPIRDPKNLKKDVGRCANPPGNLELGGKGENTKLPVKGSKFRVTDR